MRFSPITVAGILALVFATVQPVQAADALFETEHFSGAGNCAVCHNRLSDGQGNDVSIETDWSATMMANAARDPFWQAKFASEILRNPGIEDVLNDTCTRCHAPMAHEEASYYPGSTKFFGDGFVDPNNPFHDAAMDGVSCTLCHQIADDGVRGTPAGFSGDFTIEEFTNPDNRPAYGQYTGPRINPMRMNSGFTPQHADLISDSSLCASCHNLMTPVLDAKGDVIPDQEFPEQAVYTEWANSDFADGRAEASSCQECHMARADNVKIANRPRNLPRRNNFARHGFYGGNTLMLDILGANRAELGVGDGDFAAAIEATRATLADAAELLVEEASLNGAQLTVRVRVINNTGHKLPTSYPSRRAYLHLTVADEADNTLFESGKMNPDGSVVGVDADTGNGYEPHYSGAITSENQVQVYEPIMVDSNGNQTYTLLRAATYIKDNRILPRGFDAQAVPDEVAVKGLAASDQDFVAGSDLVTYVIDLPTDPAGVTVSAELNYQTLAFGFLSDLKRDAGNTTVKRFLDMYDNSKVRAETIARAVAQAGVIDGGGTGTTPPPDSDTGGDTGSGQWIPRPRPWWR